jgi:hypothetical protein
VKVRFAPTANGRVLSTFAGLCVAANGSTTDTFTLIGTGIGASITANANQTLNFNGTFLLTPNTRQFPLRYDNITTCLVLKKVATKVINFIQEKWKCQQKNDG